MHISLRFDKNMQLYPYEIVRMDLRKVKIAFVDSFINQKIRNQRFMELITYIEDFEVSQFTIWIVGSFISLKKDPEDIDIAILLKNEDYLKNIERQKDFITYSKRDFNIDLLYVLNLGDKINDKSIISGIKNNRESGFSPISMKYSEWKNKFLLHKGMNTGFVSVNIK